jgi:hypothetical protein
MPEFWTSTSKTILAAAIGTLGVPVRTERSLDERTGTARCDFFLGATCIENKVATSTIKSQYESGQLLREDPTHPVLDICYAKQIRDRILDAIKTGARIEFVRQAGTDRTFYRHGGSNSFPGLDGVTAQFRTPDLNLVCGLSRFGAQIRHLDGPSGAHRFYFDADCILSTGESLGDFCREWRAKRVPNDHPVSYPIIGLVNYARLVRSSYTDTQQVLIRKPNSSKSAIIDPNTTGAGMDKMQKFFIG